MSSTHKHEPRNCPRCNKTFECKVGNIAQCQCSSIVLSEEEKAKREAEKAKRFKISGGKRGRPAKKPKLDY